MKYEIRFVSYMTYEEEAAEAKRLGIPPAKVAPPRVVKRDLTYEQALQDVAQRGFGYSAHPQN